jgi:hypothetical protein
MRKRSELYTDHKCLENIFTQSNLNLRQRTWLELIKDYDLGINYHPGKANGFYRGFAKNSVGIRFHLGDCGSTGQGSSLYIYQDYLLRTATSRVVYVKDSVFAWSVEEDCV